MNNDSNQTSEPLEKLPCPSDPQSGFGSSQQYMDNQLYTIPAIRRYEKMFGAGYVSTGGHSATKEFVDLLNLKPGQKVLDVGCGIGGGDFYMAKNFGVEVLGVDLSHNMVDIATERARAEKLTSVRFEVCDATKGTFPESSFDVIYSKGALMHIPDKLALVKRFHSWLKPGGQLLLSDYCCGEKPWTPVFAAYVKRRGCSLCTPAQYGQFIREAGFCNVRAEDRTAQFIGLVKAELQRAEAIKEEFIEELSEEDHLAMVNRWKEKIECSNSGDHRWGLFHATKN